MIIIVSMKINMRIISLIVILLTITTEAYIHVLSKNPLYRKSNKIILNSQKKNNYIICNEKYIYKSYLVSLRKVKKTIKNSSNNDIIKQFNIIMDYINNAKQENAMIPEQIFITGNNSCIDNNELIAKTLLISNIKVDISNVKYVKISTQNDTLVVELDKNKDICKGSDVVKYDIKKLDSFITALSILSNVFNIH